MAFSICIVPALFFSVSYGFLHLHSACLVLLCVLCCCCFVHLYSACLVLLCVLWLSPSVLCLPSCCFMSHHGLFHLYSACLVAFQCPIMAFTICEVPALLPFSVLSWLSPSVKCLPCCLSVSYHVFIHLCSASLATILCLVAFSICIVFL